MKNKFFICMMMVLLSCVSSYAGTGVKVNERVINSFRKDFATAQSVVWEKSNEYVKATFTLNQQVMFAWYDRQGSLMAVSRNIVSTQLPIRLLTEVKKHYAQYWITDLFEIAMNNETIYYITLENGDHKLVLRSTGAAGWELYRKTRERD